MFLAVVSLYEGVEGVWYGGLGVFLPCRQVARDETR